MAKNQQLPRKSVPSFFRRPGDAHIDDLAASGGPSAPPKSAPAPADEPPINVPAGVTNYFAILGVRPETDNQQILIAHAAAIKSRPVEDHPQIDAAKLILTNNERRAIYDEMVSGATGRWKITGFFGDLVRYANTLQQAHKYQCEGKKVIDQTPEMPGGFSDPDAVCQYRIEIPAGRRWAGETFEDSWGTKFVKGVGFANNVEGLHMYRTLDWIIQDRGEFWRR